MERSYAATCVDPIKYDMQFMKLADTIVIVKNGNSVKFFKKRLIRGNVYYELSTRMCFDDIGTSLTLTATDLSGLLSVFPEALPHTKDSKVYRYVFTTCQLGYHNNKLEKIEDSCFAEQLHSSATIFLVICTQNFVICAYKEGNYGYKSHIAFEAQDVPDISAPRIDLNLTLTKRTHLGNHSKSLFSIKLWTVDAVFSNSHNFRNRVSKILAGEAAPVTVFAVVQNRMRTEFIELSSSAHETFTDEMLHQSGYVDHFSFQTHVASVVNEWSQRTANCDCVRFVSELESACTVSKVVCELALMQLLLHDTF